MSSIERIEGSKAALSTRAVSAGYVLPAVNEERKRFLRGVAEGLKARERKRSAHLDHMRREWRAAGLAEAHRLTKCFVEADPDLRKVVLFGSLATGDVDYVPILRQLRDYRCDAVLALATHFTPPGGTHVDAMRINAAELRAMIAQVEAE